MEPATRGALRCDAKALLQRITVPLQTLPNPRERVLARPREASVEATRPLDQDFQAGRRQDFRGESMRFMRFGGRLPLFCLIFTCFLLVGAGFRAYIGVNLSVNP